MEIIISQLGGESTTLFLTEHQGEQIRALVEQGTRQRWSTYLDSVGLFQTNMSPILKGKRKLSKSTLDRLLSGTEYEAECRIEFVIQKRAGEDVNAASCPNLEEQLFSEQLEEWTEKEELTDKQSMDGVPSTGEDDPHSPLDPEELQQIMDEMHTGERIEAMKLRTPLQKAEEIRVPNFKDRPKLKASPEILAALTPLQEAKEIIRKTGLDVNLSRDEEEAVLLDNLNNEEKAVPLKQTEEIVLALWIPVGQTLIEVVLPLNTPFTEDVFPSSFFSEKPLENTKTSPESDLQEKQEES